MDRQLMNGMEVWRDEEVFFFKLHIHNLTAVAPSMQLSNKI